MGQEKLKSISSKGSSQQPRTSTPVESAHRRLGTLWNGAYGRGHAGASSSAGAVARPKTNGASASQARAQSTGPRQRVDPKTKQRTTDQQGIRGMVTKVMEHHGISQEDWEQSQQMDYRVDPLNPPTWVIRRPTGQHLATLESASVDEWQAVPDITADELLRQLTMLAEGTSQACSYRSQELYFQII